MDWSSGAVAIALVVLVGAAIGVASRMSKHRMPPAEPTLDEKVRTYRRSKYVNSPGLSGMAGGLFGAGVWASGDGGGGFDGSGAFDGGGFDGGGGDGGGG